MRMVALDDFYSFCGRGAGNGGREGLMKEGPKCVQFEQAYMYIRSASYKIGESPVVNR